MLQFWTRGLGLAAALGLIAFVSFNAGAASGAPEVESRSVWERMHDLGRKLHGLHPTPASHGHGDPASALTRLLALTPEQVDRAEAVHRAVAEQHAVYHETMLALHDRLIEQFRAGTVDGESLKLDLDGRLMTLGQQAHAVVDEAIGFSGTLDASQRELLLQHLEQLGDRHLF